MEEEDTKESVKELNAISHDEDEDAREALEELEEINDFFGLKRMDDDDMKVERLVYSINLTNLPGIYDIWIKF